MRVMVTGGSGSIGPALIQELKERDHDVFSFDLVNHPLADVREPFDSNGAEIVYHLAADKHAPMGEDHPYHTQRVNIEGTANALRSGAAKVILASTCKAAVPETVYGASKMIAERLVLNQWGVVGRLYNVRESNRNVFELWDEQYEASGRIDVTACTRFFITLDEACVFLADLLTMPSGRYAPDPGAPHQMLNVARKWCRDRSVDPSVVSVVAPRRGDRLVEPLHGPHETISRVEGRSFNEITCPHDTRAQVPA